jgi:bifunctional non-homologous end joining protein LigD
MLYRIRPPGFIEPCLPSPADKPPRGANWIHEIKHDGFRLMARRDASGIRLLTRNGHDWTYRLPLIAEAMHFLRARSCLIDGEAVARDGRGQPVFEHRADRFVVLYAFDLLELNGRDLRREPIEARKKALVKLLRRTRPGLRFIEHLNDVPGDVVFRHACKLGLEGIVSKRLGSRYRSGPDEGLAQVQESNALAVKRQAEEDWGR